MGHVATNDDFYEDDEDPAAIHRTFDSGETFVTERPAEVEFDGAVNDVPTHAVSFSWSSAHAEPASVASSTGTARSVPVPANA